MFEAKIDTRKAVLAIFGGITVLTVAQLGGQLTYLLPLPEALSGLIFAVIYVGLAYYLLITLCPRLLGMDLSQCFVNSSFVHP